MFDLIKVWFVDDQNAGIVANTLKSIYNVDNYNKCLDIHAFDSADIAIKSLRDGTVEIPDIAIIDLNFNDQTDRGLLLKSDHLTHDIHKQIVNEDLVLTTQTPSNKISKNQLGFWVATELVHASKEIGKAPPLLKLFTANHDIQKQLSWASIPSPFCNKAYIDIDYKGESTVESIIDDYKDMLLEVARLRIKKYGNPPELVDAIFKLYDFIQSLIAKTEINYDHVFKQLSVLCNGHLKLAKSEQVKLSQVKIGYVYNDLKKLSLCTDVKKKYTDVANFCKSKHDLVSNLLDTEYISTFNELCNRASNADSSAITQNDINAFNADYVFSTSTRKLIAPFFPTVARWLLPKNISALEYLPIFKTDLENALELLSDYHWELCRLLKKVKSGNDELGNVNYVLATKLATACHPMYANISEKDLQLELKLDVSLPAQTKLRLGLKVDNFEYDMPLTRLAERLSGSKSNGTACTFDRSGWQQDWSSLNLLIYESIISSFDTSPKELQSRLHLTDWECFFTGQNSLLSKLKNEVAFLNSEINVHLKEINTISNILRLSIVVKLSQPLLNPPSGGILSALESLHMWGESVWQATVGNTDCAELWAGSIWPIRAGSRIGSWTSPEYYFKIDWTFNDYLLRRTAG